MDNVTHSLVGAALAQAAIQYRLYRNSQAGKQQETSLSVQPLPMDPGQSSELGSEEIKTTKMLGARSISIAALPMYIASILANNFPDLDLFVTMFMEGRLGYILHHRGHTHTLMFAPVQVLLLAGVFWLYARWKKPAWSREDWGWLLGLAWVGCFVHIAMDSWNVYGVHPFWPFNNHWYYGDFVFILEPLFWAILIPWLLTGVRQRWTRNTLLVLYTLGFVGWFVAYFQAWWYPLVLTTLCLGFGYVVVYYFHANTRMWVSFGTLCGTLSILWGSSVWVRADLTKAIHKTHKQEQVKDIAIMSYPSNPFCYLFVSMSYRAHDGQYISRRGTYAFFPKGLPCPQIGVGQTAPLRTDTSVLQTTAGKPIGPVQMFARPIGELQKIVKEHCRVKAVMQFIRVPYWQHGDQHILVGDLRFDRRKEFDLADFLFPLASKDCPTLLPPWVPPLSTRGFW